MAGQDPTLGMAPLIVLANGIQGTPTVKRTETENVIEIVTGIAGAQTSATGTPGTTAGTTGLATMILAGRRLMNDTMNRDLILVALVPRHGRGIPSLISILRLLFVLWMTVGLHPLKLMDLALLVKSDRLNLVFIDQMTVLWILVHLVLWVKKDPSNLGSLALWPRNDPWTLGYLDLYPKKGPSILAQMTAMSGIVKDLPLMTVALYLHQAMTDLRNLLMTAVHCLLQTALSDLVRIGDHHLLSQAIN